MKGFIWLLVFITFTWAVLITLAHAPAPPKWRRRPDR